MVIIVTVEESTSQFYEIYQPRLFHENLVMGSSFLALDTTVVYVEVNDTCNLLQQIPLSNLAIGTNFLEPKEGSIMPLIPDLNT